MKNSNYILKVTNAKKAEIKKALKDAGIEVRALTEVYSEEIKEEESKQEDAKEKTNGQ